MGLKKLFLITVLAGAMSVLGCGDDETGGTGATGGDGATGGAGATGGDGGTGGSFDFDTACDRELCADNETLKMECETLVAACRTEPQANQDECIILITEKCDGG